MKLLICSDIHGSLNYTKKFIDYFDNNDIDKIVLLGDLYYHGPRNKISDDYNPMEVSVLLNKYKDNIIAVRGNCDAEVDQMISDFDISNDYKIINVDGKDIYFTHGHLVDKYKDMFKDNIFFYGHTHVYDLDSNYINPGSVGLPKKNKEHTFIVLDNNTITLIDLDNFNIIKSRKINL